MKLRDLRVVFADGMLFFAKNHFPTQNLLSDAEVTICKYKYLILSVNTFILGCLKWLRGTVEGRKIGKHLQMTLSPKITSANICKYDFLVLYIFTFVNAGFCTFFHFLSYGSLMTPQSLSWGWHFVCSSLYVFILYRK